MEQKHHDQWIKQFYRSSGYKLTPFLNDHTSITANQLTYFRLLCGLVTAGLYVVGGRGPLLFSAITLFLFSMLDAADGSLSELQKKSFLGGWLDVTSDAVVVFFLMLGLSLSILIHLPEARLFSLLPLATFGVMQMLAQMDSMKYTTKLFERPQEENKDSVKEESTSKNLETLKVQLTPFNANYHLILFLGAIFNRIYFAAIFLSLYVGFWWVWKFVKTCLEGIELDNKNDI